MEVEMNFDGWSAANVKKFLASVDMRGPDDCWPWVGQLLPNGHGIFNGLDNVGSRGALALSYEVFIGLCPPKKAVRRSCNNRICVNPQHMRLITWSGKSGWGPANAKKAKKKQAAQQQRKKRALKSECIRGHDLTDPNNYYLRRKPGVVGDSVTRECKLCKEIRNAASPQRNQAKLEENWAEISVQYLKSL